MPTPRTIIVFAALGLLACLWLAACAPPPATESAGFASDPYVGAQVCAECHAAIVERQALSPHAQTLRAVSGEWHAGKPSTGVRLADRSTGLEHGVITRDGRTWQFAARGGKEIDAAAIDYLVGSGQHGVSPMNFDGAQWRYLALTYYAAHGWDFSPMRSENPGSAQGKDLLGVPVSPDDLRKCFRCHATRLEFRHAALDAARSELGVRCESCHGPGRAHVEAARAKAANLAIDNPRKWSTPSFMALCQQCHNETSTLEGVMSGIPTDPHSPKTVKYHVHGIEKSRCFTRSNGAFRCTTCHDPHSRNETQPRFYENRCLSCHTPKAPVRSPAPRVVACPVNPRNGCLGCHMPKVTVEKYTQFADHWIRARSPFVKKMP